MKNTFFHEQLQFSRSFKTKLNKSLGEVGLFHSQWLVLFTIQRKGTISLVEISNYLDVEKPTVTRTVKRLEEQGFVVTITSEDKRERPVQLTEKGQEVYEQGFKKVSNLEKDILKRLPEDELLVAQKVIQQLHEILHEGGF